jgi:hypothetical protein
MTNFKGSGVALVTPFKSDKSVDFDALRNLVRASNRSSNFSALTYSRALKRACTDASAVIVASPEQAEQILKFNKNVFVGGGIQRVTDITTNGFEEASTLPYINIGIKKEILYGVVRGEVILGKIPSIGLGWGFNF